MSGAHLPLTWLDGDESDPHTERRLDAEYARTERTLARREETHRPARYCERCGGDDPAALRLVRARWLCPPCDLAVAGGAR